MREGDENMKLSNETVRAILERFQGEHVYEVADSYGEPGYTITAQCDDGEETPYVVLGYWWCRCDKSEGMHDITAHHPKLWGRLEEQGVELVWHDEWMVDYETDQAFRTSPDSYGWQPSVILTEDGEWLTPADDLTTWVEWAAESAGRCIPTTIAGARDMTELGFTCHERGLEAGWHPGQDADPSSVKNEIQALPIVKVAPDSDDSEPTVEVVFLLDETSQFYVGFSAWYRVQND